MILKYIRLIDSLFHFLIMKIIIAPQHTFLILNIVFSVTNSIIKSKSNKSLWLHVTLVTVLRGQVRVFVVEGICKLGPRHDTVFVVNLLYFLLRGNFLIVSSFYLRAEDSERTEMTLKYDVCLF